MRDEVLEQIKRDQGITVYQIADRLQLDVYDVSTLAVELMDDGLLYLEAGDGTLWYVEETK